MIALHILDVGSLTAKMLKGSLFDHFLLKEASVTQAFETNIDGRLRPGFYSEAELGEMGLSGLTYVPFSLVRPICLDLMKGSRKPESFRFVLMLSPENQTQTIAASGTGFHGEDVGGMFMNLAYKNDQLVCTTGISYNIFSMDKSLEQSWDGMCKLFFKKNNITVEEL